MQNGIVVNQDDIKKILAEHFNVKESQIIKSQYSYFIVTDEGAIECQTQQP